MKKIPLTRGKFALVDDEDYNYLMQWKWICSAVGYAVRSEYSRDEHGKRVQKAIWMHRVILKIQDNLLTDHIDCDKLNNQKANLRSCTHGENMMNFKIKKNNTSGFKGVHWAKREQKWVSRIGVNGKKKLLGYFSCKIQAAKAYNDAAKHHFGEFAKLNQI